MIPSYLSKTEEAPSTSNSPSHQKLEKFCLELDLNLAFGKMMIGCRKYRNEEQVNIEDDTDKPSCSKEISTQEKRRSSCSFRSSRFTPYILPKKTKTTRSKSVSEIDFKALEKIRWQGDDLDMDYLKLGILDEKKNIPCGVEATRPPTLDIDEIDELADYFAHFVQVELKISAMAESMYC